MISFFVFCALRLLYGITYSKDAVDSFATFSGIELFIEIFVLLAFCVATVITRVADK